MEIATELLRNISHIQVKITMEKKPLVFTYKLLVNVTRMAVVNVLPAPSRYDIQPDV